MGPYLKIEGRYAAEIFPECVKLNPNKIRKVILFDLFLKIWEGAESDPQTVLIGLIGLVTEARKVMYILKISN